MKKQFRQFKKGLALIEILVGISVFIAIFAAISGLFVFTFKVQRKALVKEEALGQLSFALEYMSRTLRMAVKDSEGTCLSSTDLNYENPGGKLSSIRFINHLQEDDCQEFFLENNVLKYKKGIGATEKVYDLTSPSIEIQNLNFYLSGESVNDTLQPKVTIVLKTNAPDFSLPLDLQTTISQRNLDVE
jgi:type II secretory pathway pseudopilin PulG